MTTDAGFCLAIGIAIGCLFVSCGSCAGQQGAARSAAKARVIEACLRRPDTTLEQCKDLSKTIAKEDGS